MGSEKIDKKLENENGSFEYTEQEAEDEEVFQHVEQLSEEELEMINGRLCYMPQLLGFYNEKREEECEAWTLADLDLAFMRWIETELEYRHKTADVMTVFGAAFGDYLIRELDMQWVKVTDKFGTDFAVKCVDKNTMTFPFASVQKRIDAGEHTFFEAIYNIVKHTIENDE